MTNIDEQITLSGWVSTIRDLGGILFVELRDRSGFFQIVANPQINPQVHKVLERVKSEYVIKVVGGKFQKDLKKLIMKNTLTGQVEMYPESVEILSESKSFTICFRR